MRKLITYGLLMLGLLVGFGFAAVAQTRIAGKVTDEKQEALAGVSIAVKGKVIGTITDQRGNFSLSTPTPVPFTVVVSSVGFQTQEFVINGNRTDLNVALKEQVTLGQEVIVSASRVAEDEMKSPVSVEKMDIRAIQSTPAATFYDGLRNLKGVEVSQQSLTFSSINTRGFTGNGNVRVVQMIDGMDNQAPGLNFAVGNIVGLSELDVESVELLPGAASALYGPNATNGLLLMTSKSPFLYQGLSAQAKTGLMSASNRTTASGASQTTTPFYDLSLRYAKAFNNRLAFKVNASYLRAQDWQATDYRDQNFVGGTNRLSSGTRQNDPNYNGINVYGDENSSGAGLGSLQPLLGQLLTVGSTAPGLAAIAAANPNLARLIGGINQFSAQTRIPTSQLINDLLLPNGQVSRTGYTERELVDYTTKSLKLSGALHYRFNDKVEGILQANWGTGTTVYTSSDRYYLNNFRLAQYKAELRGANFFLRAYSTQERSGDTYAAGILAQYVNEAWKRSAPASSSLTDVAAAWYPQYGLAYAGGAFQAFLPAFQAALATNPTNPAAAYQAALQVVNGAAVSQAIQANARNTADAGRLLPGTAAFNQVADVIKNTPIPGGAKFLDRTNLYHFEGMYNLRNVIDPKIVDITLGANYRIYALNSGGTLFLTKPDGGEYSISEYGGYAQAIRNFGSVLKLTGSLRYDKNQNFQGQFSPRLSAVISATRDHNFRASYQTGFRIPTTQNQYINLLTPVSLLVGGLNPVLDRYKLRDGRTTIIGTSTVYNFPEFKPEKVITYEVGYKGLIANKLLIDAYYYNSQFRNYVGGVILNSPNVVSASGTPIPVQTVNNYTGEIKYHGFGLGVEYVLPRNYILGANVSNNTLRTGGVGLFDSKKNLNVLEDGFQVGFNTPKYRYNASIGNRNINNSGLGFNVTFRYQDAFYWQDLLQPVQARNFANSQQTIMPAFGTLDAQVSYRLPSIKSILKVGGSNITRNEYRTSWGNPTIGAMYYVSLTFDQLMNR